jgi:glycosyltransferase involved in cell wall biosynthesis
MKLAYIVNANLPPNDWAHTVQIMNMCKVFAEAGAEVTLFIPNRDMPKLDPFIQYGMKRIFTIEQVACIDIFPSHPHPIFYWIRLYSFYISVRIKLLVRHFDVMYSRDLYAPLFFPGSFIERHSFPKSVSFIHRLAFRMAGGIIVLTSFIKERIVRVGVKDAKVLVAPDAVDIDAFNNPASFSKIDIPNIGSHDFILGYIGTLKTMNMEKGVADCLSSLKELPEKFKLLVVGGEIVDIDYYKKMAEDLQVASRVIFVGKVLHTEIPSYARICNVLLAPFPENEHYSFFMSPLKIFEYMASHRPIISTSLPSIKEVLTSNVNAVLVPPSDPKALAQAILKLHDDPAFAKRISDQAYSDVVIKYTWKKRAENILSFIQHL